MSTRAREQATQTIELTVGEGLIGQVGVCKKPAWNVDVSTDPDFQRQRVALGAGGGAELATNCAVFGRVRRAVFHDEQTGPRGENNENIERSSSRK